MSQIESLSQHSTTSSINPNNFKEFKKKCHSDIRGSVKGIYYEKMNEFEKYYKTLPNKKKELKKLIKNKALQAKIQNLKDEIKIMENQQDENEFILKTLPFLEIENKIIENEQNTTDKGKIDSYYKSKGTINREENYYRYLEILGIPSNYTFQRIIFHYEPKCPECNDVMITVEYQGRRICENCGIEESIINNKEPGTYTDDTCIPNTFIYKRSNHFRDWLSQLQARESTCIPAEVIILLKKELKKLRITKTSEITYEKVRILLKKLKLNKYYENISSIIQIITKTPVEQMPNELQNRLCIMFEEIQEPFKIHCPSERKNFLSYAYCLYKNV